MPMTPVRAASSRPFALGPALYDNLHFAPDAASLPANPARRALAGLSIGLAATLLPYALWLLPGWLADGAVYVSGTLAVLAFFVSLIALPGLDVVAARAGRFVVARDFAGQADTLPDFADPDARAAYLAGRHGLAQLLCWRLAWAFIGMRVAVAGLLILLLFKLIAASGTWSILLTTRAASDQLAFWLLWPTGIILLAAYLCEPLWRLRAMTAWGMHFAVRDEGWRPATALLALPAAYWALAVGYFALAHRLVTEAIWLGAYIITLRPDALSWYYQSTGRYAEYRQPFAGTVFAVLLLTLLFIAFMLVFHALMTRASLTGADGALADPAWHARLRARFAPHAPDLARPLYPPLAPLTYFARLVMPDRALWDNPTFALDARRLRNGRSPQTLVTYSRRVALGTLAIWAVLMGVWLLLRWGVLTAHFGRPGFLLQSYMVEVVMLTAFLSVALNLLLDASAMLSGLNTINADMLAGRWDTLRLTAQPEGAIIAAKHGLTQLRSWRLLTVVMTLRLATLGLLTVYTFGFTLGIGLNWQFFHLYGVTNLLITPGNSVISLGWALLFALVYLFEPALRLRVMAMLAVANSVGRDTSGALLTGFATIVGVLLSQIALGIGIIAAVMLAQSLILEALIGSGPNYNAMVNLFTHPLWLGYQLALTIGLPPLLVGAYWLYYSALLREGRRRVLRRAFEG